ncbi:hypothetical protein [Lacunimicrobium album]
MLIAPPSKTRDQLLLCGRSITSGVARYLFVRGFHEYGIFFAKAGIEFRYLESDFEAAATQYAFLERQLLRAGDLEGIQEVLIRLEELFAKTSSQTISAIAALVRGDLASNRGEYDVALTAYEEAATFYRESTDDDDESRYRTGMHV